MTKQKKIGYITLITTVITIILVLFLLPPYQDQMIALSKDNPLLAPFIIIVLRIIGMVIPPIPGGLVAFALIPVIGWFWAYLYGVIGTTIGAVVAFFIARKFREKAVAHFVPLQQLHKWEATLSHKKKFWAFLLIRISTGPVMDFISYVAGLTKISFKTFLVATLIAEIPSGLVYFLGEKSYEQVAGSNNYIGVGLLLLLGLAYYFFKDHEFFKGKKKA